MQHLLFMYAFLFNRYNARILVLTFLVLSSATPKLSGFPNEYSGRLSTHEDSPDSLLTGTMDDSFDLLLPSSHDDNDVVLSHLHGIQDSAHIRVVVAQQDNSHYWLNELNEVDFFEWMSGMESSCTVSA
ncbi:hypothetical protein GUJ93_ZPchr0007g4068 [Zizania palustris]|uniref:Uncharacterized protein n=1 Tax=Zizania palustris TaxID=103762 RepID=A0A8J5SSQ8_ZIZPA|nr:hypothetical protein GUJ93_ZPchr0007g4068 [Zizania palustris]